MSRTAWKAIIVLGLADIVAFALTIHSHLSFHRTPDGPSSMSVGQVLGWFVSVTLLVLIAIVAKEARQSANTRWRKPGLGDRGQPTPRTIDDHLRSHGD